MKLSAILAPLVAAGIDAETLLKTVRAYEEQQESEIEKRREADRNRQRRHRGHVMSRDVTVTERDERDTPPLDKEKSPTPPKEINPPRETKLARRLPDDWVLPASWGKWALDEGYSEAIIRLEADKFGDFWHAKGGKDAKKLDWEKTWRNWIRNVPKSRGSPLSQAPPRETEFARHQRECREAIQRKLNGHDDDDDFAGPAFDLEPGNYSAH